MIEKMPFAEIQLTRESSNVYQAGETIEGKLFIRPLTTDLNIHLLSCELVMELRGRLEPEREVVQTVELVRNGFLEKGQQYEYAFSFVAPKQISFFGKNISLLWSIQSHLEVDDATRAAMRNQSLRQLKLLKALDPLDDFRTSADIRIRSPRYHYFIKENALPLKIHQSANWKVFFSFLAIGATIAAFKDKWVEAIISVIIATGLYKLLSRLVVHLHMGKPTIDVDTPDEEQIILSLQLARNHQAIRRLSLWYEVREEVEDHRGTSVEYHDEIIFKSQQQERRRPGKLVDVRISLPENDAPGTLRKDNFRIYWLAQLEIETRMGLTYRFQEELIVKKQLKVPN